MRSLLTELTTEVKLDSTQIIYRPPKSFICQNGRIAHIYQPASLIYPCHWPGYLKCIAAFLNQGSAEHDWRFREKSRKKYVTILICRQK